VLATLSTSRTAKLIAHGHSSAVALTGGYRLAFWIAAGLVVLGIGVALTVVQTPPAAAMRVGAEDDAPSADVSDRDRTPSESERVSEPVYSEV